MFQRIQSTLTSSAAIAAFCLATMSTVAANSLESNPPINTQINLTNAGMRFLFAWFAIFTLSTLIIGAWSTRLPVQHRAFHFIALAILATSSIAYFTMASNLGNSPVYTEFGHRGFGFRQIWWIRYIDWIITSPLLLLTLLLTTGLPLSAVFVTLFLDTLMVASFLGGAHVSSSYKWGFFAFGVAILLFIVYMMVGPARKSTRFFGAEYTKVYSTSAAFLMFFFLIYPICWGLSEGGNVLSINAEMVFYGVLDFFVKPVFLMYHLWSIRNLDYEALRLQSGKASAYSTVKHDPTLPTSGMVGNRGVVNPAPTPNINNLNDTLNDTVNPIANNTSYQPAQTGVGAVAPTAHHEVMV